MEEGKVEERSRANKSSQQDANNAAPAVPVNLQTAHLDPERYLVRGRQREGDGNRQTGRKGGLDIPSDMSENHQKLIFLHKHSVNYDKIILLVQMMKKTSTGKDGGVALHPQLY